MRSPTSGLTTRQYERESADLSVEFVIASNHRAQVCFSATSSATDDHTIRGRVVDVSSGGMGLALSGFVPRMCEGAVRVFSPTPCDHSSDGTPIHDVIFEHKVKVRRVAMRDQTPSYNIGVAFIDPEPTIEDRVERLLSVMSEAKAAYGMTDQAGGIGDVEKEGPDA